MTGTTISTTDAKATAGSGGVICMDGTSSSITLSTTCSFLRNTAGAGSGGAFYVIGTGGDNTLTMSDTTFDTSLAS